MELTDEEIKIIEGKLGKAASILEELAEDFSAMLAGRK